MKTIKYKGKGEHSVNELELIIEQQAEELHLIKSGQKPLSIDAVSNSICHTCLNTLENGEYDYICRKCWVNSKLAKLSLTPKLNLVSTAQTSC